MQKIALSEESRIDVFSVRNHTTITIKSTYTDKKILERFVLGERSFNLQYDLFQIGNETNLLGKEFITFKNFGS